MDQAILQRNRRVDFWAKKVISLGGVAILVCVVGMLAMLLMETLPLFYSPSSKELTTFELPSASSAPKPVAIGVDEYLETGYWVDQAGAIHFLDLVSGKETDSQPFSETQKVTQFTTNEDHHFSVLFEDGSAALIYIDFKTVFDLESHRTVGHQVRTVKTLGPDSFDTPPVALQIQQTESGVAAVGLLADHRVQYLSVTKEESFLGEAEEVKTSSFIDTDPKDLVKAFVLDHSGENLYLATESGKLIYWSLSEPDEPELVDLRPGFKDHRKITSIALVFGDDSLAVGDSAGEVSTWFMAPKAPGHPKKQLTRAHQLVESGKVVTEVRSSRRNKSVLSLSNGTVTLSHTTSERELKQFSTDSPITLFGFSIRGNGLLALDESNKLTLWSLDAPHPEGSWKGYFSKVWYENYQAPDYVWQSSSSSDDFEPKFSLIPLIFGSIKGTLFAMVLAVPLGIFGAIYTNQFASRRFQAVVKPAVEITSAVPSVIVGFLGALWLAPIIDEWLLGLFIFMVLLPSLMMAFLVIWARARTNLKIRLIEQSKELYLALPILLVSIVLAAWLQPHVEAWMFDGNFKQWIFDHITKDYDQRNSIVISFALGFIVIPFIFTMTDDALSAVPESMRAASVALGASRWQTTWKVLLPSASPGMFAGVILGMGRAIGETMIVLMATGNTPIIDISMFNGMRTLSANIAVEIPEAPVGGSLYRVLFLSAVILFVFTFVINSVAELFRYTLRKKYAEF